MDQDPTAIRLRLSKSQMTVIWPGLDLIVRNRLTEIRTGESPNSYPFRNLPLPRGYDSGTWSEAMMNRIFDLWGRLQPKAKTGGRVRLNFVELRVAALAARITLKLKRVAVDNARRWDAKTKKRCRLDRSAIENLERSTKRVITSLERQMKRANRQFLSLNPRYEFVLLSKTWQNTPALDPLSFGVLRAVVADVEMVTKVVPACDRRVGEYGRKVS
jgi:hypothetical protein